MDGQTVPVPEWCGYVEGPEVPAEYGNPHAIPLSVARRLVEHYDTHLAETGPHDEGRVVLFAAPKFLPRVNGYGWYVSNPVKAGVSGE